MAMGRLYFRVCGYWQNFLSKQRLHKGVRTEETRGRRSICIGGGRKEGEEITIALARYRTLLYRISWAFALSVCVRFSLFLREK